MTTKTRRPGPGTITLEQYNAMSLDEVRHLLATEYGILGGCYEAGGHIRRRAGRYVTA